MKVVILAGGLGTRLGEATKEKPKPMITIGGIPILLHIMELYTHFELREFYIALGYKGDVIKQFFWDTYRQNSSITTSLTDGHLRTLTLSHSNWTAHLVETGAETETGGRLHYLEPLLKGETFMLTYGDGLSNVNLTKLQAFHQSRRRLATVTAVKPPERFGRLVMEEDQVCSFMEKQPASQEWINGGFMVFEPQIFRYLAGPNTNLERNVLSRLASEGHLGAYRHTGFWQCMDTLAEQQQLEHLWQSGKAPWFVQASISGGKRGKSDQCSSMPSAQCLPYRELSSVG